MNITQESNGNLQAIIHINLTKEDYIEKVNSTLKDYRKKANMPGFRPGMVPMGMIKKMYGQQVTADEVNKTVSEALNNYIDENKINVLGYPMPNMEKTKPIDFSTAEGLDFFFDIGIAPEFDVDLKKEGFEVPYYKIEVTDKEVENALNDIKVRFGEEEHPEKAEEGDGVQGKFVQLDNEGNVVKGGVEHEGYFRIVDLKLKTIQKKFYGKSVDTVVALNPMNAFKDEAKVKALLGDGVDEEALKSDYQFTITDVIRHKEAELNEETFKKVFPSDDIKTIEDFKARIKKDLEKHYAKDSARQFTSDVITKLIEESNIELPDAFLKRWLLDSNQGKITEEQLESQYDSYAKTFKWQLVEDKLKAQFGNQLTVDNEAVRDKVRAYFQVQGKENSNPQIEQIVDQILSNKEEGQKIYSELMDEKLSAVFIENVKSKEEVVTPEKFMEIVQKVNV
ncbi:MAG: trigger factor [Bacteroidetes bacterium]|nr:MAG: trigger factor [Bacteroidota bacterium]